MSVAVSEEDDLVDSSTDTPLCYQKRAAEKNKIGTMSVYIRCQTASAVSVRVCGASERGGNRRRCGRTNQSSGETEVVGANLLAGKAALATLDAALEGVALAAQLELMEGLTVAGLLPS